MQVECRKAALCSDKSCGMLVGKTFKTMNISYKWLKEYVDFTLAPQEVADALTSCGLEVGSLEEVQTVRGGLKGLYVGQVLTCEDIPETQV